jgi:tetratricopeptide (TPR) repeat protein
MSGARMQRASAERVQAALELGRLDEALAEVRRLLAQDPGDPEAHALHGQVLMMLRRNAEAQQAAEAGLALAPELEWLHRVRALALLRQGGWRRRREALRAADEAVRLAPEQGAGHYLRSLVLEQRSRRKQAVLAAERALELDPQDATYHFRMADLCLGAKAPAEAERHYRRGLELEPQNAGALNNLGVAVLRQKRADEAAQLFKDAVRADPTLKLAKQNAHATVRQVVGMPEQRSPWRLLWFLINPSALFVLVFVSPVLLLWSWLRDRRVRQRMQDLRRKDPDLHRLYHRIDDDRRQRRL